MAAWVDRQEHGFVVSRTNYNGREVILKPNTGFVYKTIEAARKNAGDHQADLMRVTLTFEPIPWPEKEEK